MTYVIGVSETVLAFKPAEWDAIAVDGGYYASWSWTRFAEEETHRECAYIYARSEHGLVAVLPLWFTTVDENDLRMPRRLLSEMGVASVRYAVMSFQKSYRSTFLRHAADGGASLVNELCIRADAYAAVHGAQGTLAMHVDTATMLQLTEALGRSRAVLLDGNAVLNIADTDLEGYILRFSHQRRSQVRREMRRFTEAGYQVQRESLLSCCEEFASLAAQLENRHGAGVSSDELRDSLERQAVATNSHDVVFTARREGVLIAACLAYRSGSSLIVRMFGQDYDQVTGGEYFNLLIYEPLKYAMREGLSKVELGHTTAAAKVGRGATLEGLWAVDLSSSPLWAGDRAQTRNRARFQEVSGDACSLRSVSLPTLWGDLNDDLLRPLRP